MLTFYDDNGDEISFPYLLGAVAESELPYKRIWLVNPDPFSYGDFRITIEQDTDNSFSAWFIAKDFDNRPAGYVDYLDSLYWYMLPAYSKTPIWIKFVPSKSAETAELQGVNLRLTGEQIG